MSFSWSGSAADADDTDWFVLPPATADEPLRITTEGNAVDVRLAVADDGSDPGRQVVLTRDDDDTVVVAEPLPFGVPLMLRVAAADAYHIDLAGAGYVPRALPDDSTLALEWHLAVDSVAAYWPEEQVIEAELALRNDGSQSVEATLDLTTSHYQWTTDPDRTSVSLAAGESVVVPVSILVGADSWGTDSVLVSARAATPDGAQVTASIGVSPSISAAPVDPRPGWAVPEELLGGLDVASLALGAEPSGDIDLDQERRLFDGVTPEGPVAQANQVYRNGFSVFLPDHVDHLPLELVVDLAGDEPILVVGTIDRPTGVGGRARGDAPRVRTPVVDRWGLVAIGAAGRAESPAGRPGVRARRTRCCCSGHAPHLVEVRRPGWLPLAR